MQPDTIEKTTTLEVDSTKSIIGMLREELKLELENLGITDSFRVKQLYHWVYNKGVQSFDEMTNIAKDLRELLKQHYNINRPKIVKEQISFDGTRKWLIQFADGELAEMVYIPESERGTLCISSQVGCTLTCKFCHTGTQKLVRNLTPYEIVSQVMVVRDRLEEWPSTRLPRLVSNIVLMGMGEPLYNYENVKKAMQIVMDKEGISISRRKITLSTSGVVPELDNCASEIGVNLAVSLHATTNEIRDDIVPLNKKYPIEELLAACRRYTEISNTKKITFEYVMLDGVNDSDQDAKRLIKLIKGIPAKINLIPFNPWPGTIYKCSPWTRIQKFAEILENAGYVSPVRTPRGRDILAACGQLKSDSVRKSKSIFKKEAEEANA
ncbi:MAG: 23S rRNA (adenine(2503)-C(2))-methyltransferase RlmN [Alphaproteobacteria bacterium]|nr:23S rRNA (adenine(2503)-C(2))-methyltransferase RlmN [Alphaproteobacteria bacterium]OJV13912.1 MAG: 23S rRNA (adenine(2503)-C(2))-methyltransferase [Alphaproteobacteria bacterium 33-17]